MTKLARLRRSRDSWKRKARERAEQRREARKTKARYQKRLDALRARIEVLESSCGAEKKHPLTSVQT